MNAQLLEAQTQSEITAGELRVVAQSTFPGAKIVPIAGTTFRVTYYEACAGDGIVPIQRIQDSFLIQVVPGDSGPVAVRLQAKAKRLVKYSDKWKK